METISWKHFSNSGDLISVMCGIRQVSKDLGKKADIYQQLGVRSNYYIGAVHPILNESGEMVTMNKKMFDMISPLIASQDYVASFQEYTGQKITVDIDLIKTKIFVNTPYGAIQQWPMLAFPDMAADISVPWIHLPDAEKRFFNTEILPEHCILNYTQRYRNEGINYFFLKKYQDRLIFAGIEPEHKAFCEKWGLEIPRLIVNDFLELAYALKACKFVAGCQSFVWNLANAMGLPRILEICSFAPNCQCFVGADNYGYLHQGAAEYYFDKLFNK